MEKILNLYGIQKNNTKLEHKNIYIVQYVAFYVISLILLVSNWNLMDNEDKTNSLNTLKWGGITVSLFVILLFAASINGPISVKINQLSKEKNINILPPAQLESLESNAKLINILRNIYWGISLISIIPIVIHFYKRNSNVPS